MISLPDKLHHYTCSIAQDFRSLPSGNKKRTPSILGPGLTLHQASRSEKLMDIFHAAGHTIGVDTRRIYTTIAADILDRSEKNGNAYITYELAPYSPGQVILASCDSIEILEETIGGKKTSHCTQMMLWQRTGECQVR